MCAPMFNPVVIGVMLKVVVQAFMAPPTHRIAVGIPML